MDCECFRGVDLQENLNHAIVTLDKAPSKRSIVIDTLPKGGPEFGVQKQSF